MTHENTHTGKQNRQYEKNTLYEANAPTGKKYLFSYINGGNVLQYNKTYGRDRQSTGKAWTKAYGFFRPGDALTGKPDELSLLERELRAMGLTIVASRGDSDVLLITEITTFAKQQAKNPAAYWKTQRFVLDSQVEELSGFSIHTTSQARGLLWEWAEGSQEDMAPQIAIHEALKNVWPKYLLDSKGGSNVLKRLKLPFTPVTKSDEMPPFRIVRFDPNEVMFQYGDNEPKSPMVEIFGNPVYIGDGNSITSQSMFDLFTEHFGLSPKVAKAKTVIYEKRGDNILAIKHQHMLPKKNWKILNKQGGELFIIDNKRNITLGTAHPSYIEGYDNSVHMIATNDEIKVTEAFDAEGDDMFIMGKSIGFTKFDEKVVNTVKHNMQWYNYVTDDAILQNFRDELVPRIHRKITAALYLSLNEGDRKSYESIAAWLETIQKTELGYSPHVLELAKLGAGLHPSISQFVDKLVQTNLIDDAVNLADSPGSIYDINMDVTGNLDRKEISLAYANSKAVRDAIANRKDITLEDKPGGKRMNISTINKWLEENELYVLVTRSPVTNVSGAYMARVKNMHNRQSIADLNPLDVKEYLEGDGDGDEIHVEVLSEQSTGMFKNYLDNIKFKPISLNDFITGKKYSITSTTGKLDTMNSLIAGQTAIGEIAVLQSVYGILYKAYDSISFQDSKGFKIAVKIPQPNERITFPQAIYKGELGGWTGTIGDYLRIWQQAALDNNEFGLLYEWNYNVRDIMHHILGRPDKDWFDTFWNVVYNEFKGVRSVRAGQDNIVGKYSFTDTLMISQNILKQLNDMQGIDLNRESNLNIAPQVSSFKTKSDILSPIEYVAIAPQQVWNRIENNYNLRGHNVSPFILNDNIHRKSHNSAMKYIWKNIDEILKTKIEQDKKAGNIVGDVKEWRKSQMIEAHKYVVEMGQSFFEILKELRELGSQSMDRNDKLVDWKLEYGSKFKELSNTAKAVATLGFLDGYKGLNEKLEDAKGARWPATIPSASKSKKEISLLDAGILNVFFKQYNKVATDPNFRKKFHETKVVKTAPHKAIEDYLKQACRGFG